MKIKITADSTADLPAELCKQYDIELIPLSVLLGDKVYFDGVDISPQMIYEHVAKTKQLPKTSATNGAQYFEAFERILKQGYDAIVHLSISSEMSASYQNAKEASKQFENVFVIDSRNLSTAIALQAIYASELAKNGVLPQEIVQKVESRRDNINSSFVPKELEYLYRGGRCSAVAHIGAKVLGIKPCISVKNGKMGVEKKYIGTYSKCVMKYVQETLKKYPNPDYSRIFITHTDVEPQLLDEVKNYIKQNTKFDEIIENVAGSTITSHCGANTLGILFYVDGEETDKQK